MIRGRDVIAARALLPLLLLAALPGCGGGEDEEEAPSASRRRESGPPVVVEASVDAARVDIGARVVYTVRVRYDPAYEVDFPPVLEQFENWLVYDAGYWVDEPDVGTKKVKQIDVTLDPGIGPVLTVPPTTIRWRRKGEEAWEETVTEEITVEVASVTEEAPEFREPLDVFALPEPPRERDARARATVLVAVGGAAVLLGVLFLVLFKKKKERKAPPLPPHEIAQRDLAHLDSMGLLDAGRVKEYYYRLTSILRRYIELRFGIMAPEQTTEEFLAEMRRSSTLPRQEKTVLEEFLEAADMVKYAGHTPPRAEARRAFDTAERFVKVTIPGRSAEPATPAEREAEHAL